jgi:putative DNA primase/helicase
MNEAGLFIQVGEEKKAVWKKVAGPFAVPSLVRALDSSEWGLRVEFSNSDAVAQSVVVPHAELQNESGKVCAMLASLGLFIAPNNSARAALVYYLAEQNPRSRERLLPKTGYHLVDGERIYALPSGVVGPATGEVLRLSSQVHTLPFAASGTLQEWKTQVAAKCVGNTRCVFAVAASLASTLLHGLQRDCIGFNFVGQSSTGKTTLLRLATSVFGGPDLINQSRATANGIEAIAEGANDAVLILDELGQMPAHEAGAVVYMLGNGQGKQRANGFGNGRVRKSWRLITLASGEIRLAQHVADGGKPIRAGQEVRFLDMAADAGQSLGVFEVLHGAADGGALADELRTTASRYYGTAGPAMAQAVLERWDRIRSMVDPHVEAITADLLAAGDGGSGIEGRVASAFALVGAAGELASEFGITGWNRGESSAAAKACHAAWIGEINIADDALSPADLVRSFIAKHRDTRFSQLVTDKRPEAATPRISNRAGWITDHAEIYIIPSVFTHEVCKGLDLQTVREVLAASGFMGCQLEGGKKRYTLKRECGDGIGCMRVCVISTVIFNSDGEDAMPDVPNLARKAFDF